MGLDHESPALGATTLGGPSRMIQLTHSPEDVCVCVCVCVRVCVLSHVQPFATPWTAACQASLYWEIPSPGDLPDPRIEAVSLALASRFFTTSANHNIFNSLIN